MTAIAVETPTTTSRRPRPVHTRTQVLGLTLLPTGLFIVLAIGKFEGLEFFGPMIVIPALAAFLAWRFGTWAKVLGAVLALAFLAMNAPYIPAVLGQPAAFFDFAPIGTSILGAVVGVGGGIAAVRNRRNTATEATPAERRARTVVLAIIATATAVSAVVSLASRTTVAAEDRAGAVEADLVDFTITEASAAPGGKLVVSNSDATVHTYTVDELGIDVEVLPGSEKLVELPADAAPGTYTVYCRPHAHDGAGGEKEGMVGTLTVG